MADTRFHRYFIPSFCHTSQDIFWLKIKSNAIPIRYLYSFLRWIKNRRVYAIISICNSNNLNEISTNNASLFLKIELLRRLMIYTKKEKTIFSNAAIISQINSKRLNVSPLHDVFYIKDINFGCFIIKTWDKSIINKKNELNLWIILTIYIKH